MPGQALVLTLHATEQRLADAALNGLRAAVSPLL